MLLQFKICLAENTTPKTGPVSASLSSIVSIHSLLLHTKNMMTFNTLMTEARQYTHIMWLIKYWNKIIRFCRLSLFLYFSSHLVVFVLQLSLLCVCLVKSLSPHLWWWTPQSIWTRFVSAEFSFSLFFIFLSRLLVDLSHIYLWLSLPLLSYLYSLI